MFSVRATYGIDREAAWKLPLWEVFECFHCWAFCHQVPVIKVDSDKKLLDLYKETVEKSKQTEDGDDDDGFEDDDPISVPSGMTLSDFKKQLGKNGIGPDSQNRR